MPDWLYNFHLVVLDFWHTYPAAFWVLISLALFLVFIGSSGAKK